MEPGRRVVLNGSYWEKSRESISDRPIKDSGPEGTKVRVILPRLNTSATEELGRGTDVGGRTCWKWALARCAYLD